MIRFFIMNGKNSVKFDMPTDDLFKHLGGFGNVNKLCHKLDGLWRISAEELENAFAESDVHGAANMDKAYENLREELLGQSHELKM